MTASTQVAALLIGGERRLTPQARDVRSPFSGDIVGRVAWGGAAEARQAVTAAAGALRSPIPAYERAEILERAAAGLATLADHAATTISAEAGKPIRAAHVEVQRTISTLSFSAIEARQLAGEVVPLEGAAAGAGKLGITIRRPIGIVGAITPFNFPLNLVAHKVAPAFAAGCPVVLKPADKTPLSALLLAEQMEAAGLPAGWLNVVVGPPREIAGVLVDDERVAAITFTGSAGVGWSLAERAARKKVLLELGNATPVIVDASADLEAAVARIVPSAFGFAGQTCISVQRVYVVGERYETFVEQLLEHVGRLRVGDPSDPATDVGPVIDASARRRILDAIDQARRAGATILTGAVNGDLIAPTVIADASPELAVSHTEIFGPVLVVNRVQTLDEAFKRANATDYGLHAGIFTNNLSNALLAARELEFAGVVVNETPTFRVDHMPYGGDAASGNTREGPHYAVREFTTERLLVINQEG